MARLPRFQESGLISADVPRLDFANLREGAKGFASLSENLDKISSFAFGKVKEEEKEKNRILGIQLRADSELEIQKVLDNLSGMVDRNELTYEQAQNEVKAMQGFARGLAEVDMEQASGLMRSISTSGNALLRKVSDVETARYAADIDVKSAEAVRSLSRNLKDVWGLYSNGQMTEQEVIEREAGARGIMHGIAGKTQATIKKYLDADGAFERARISARNSAMASYLSSPNFAPDEMTALSKMSNNDFGVFGNIAKNFGDQELKDIKKAVADNFIATGEAANRSKQQRKAGNDLLFTELYRNYVDPKVAPDVKDDIRKQLLLVADTSEEIDRILKMSSTSRDPLLFSNLREQIFRKQITDIKQLQRYSRVLSSDELNQLQTQFMSTDRDVDSQINRDINRYAGVPDNAVSTFNPKDAAYVKGQNVREIYNGLVDKAMQENARKPADKIIPIDKQAFKQQAIDQYESTEKKNAAKNTAEANLENLTSEKKLTNPITVNSNIEDLRRTRKFKETELQYIQEQINIIKGVK
jgi:hypothetical protein